MSSLIFFLISFSFLLPISSLPPASPSLRQGLTNLKLPPPCCVTEDAVDHLILLPLPPKRWDYKPCFTTCHLRGTGDWTWGFVCARWAFSKPRYTPTLMWCFLVLLWVSFMCFGCCYLLPLWLQIFSSHLYRACLFFFVTGPVTEQSFLEA